MNAQCAREASSEDGFGRPDPGGRRPRPGPLERPDRFDLTRDPSGHVGFGMGIHQCVGRHVARPEAESLLAALARRVGHLELAGEPRRHLNNTPRSWASLPVRVRPHAQG
ncbi:hypothetical protein STENM327S_00255 [Streptomyces tendae]